MIRESGVSFRILDAAGRIDVSARFSVGAWRSLVAHRNGVAVVGGSNPLAPTSWLLLFTVSSLR